MPRCRHADALASCSHAMRRHGLCCSLWLCTVVRARGQSNQTMLESDASQQKLCSQGPLLSSAAAWATPVYAAGPSQLGEFDICRSMKLCGCITDLHLPRKVVQLERG